MKGKSKNLEVLPLMETSIQNKAKEFLLDSEQRYRLLFQNSPLCHQSLDADGKFVEVNQMWTETIGFEKDEVAGRWFGDFLTPSSQAVFTRQFPNFKEKGKLQCEFEMIHKNGKIIDVSYEGCIAIDMEENCWHTHDVLFDISLYKKSEMERVVIYEVSQGLTTTDNLADLLLLIHQSLLKVLYAENIFVALYNEHTGLFDFPYWVDAFDPVPEPDAMQKSLSSYVFRTGKPLLFSTGIFQQLKAQNEVELVGSSSPSWIGAPLQTPDKTIGVIVLQHYEKENVYTERDTQFLFAVGSQIAIAIERKLAEEKLRNERLLLRTVIDNIPDSIYSKDIASRKTLANLTNIRHVGLKTESEILGKSDFDLYPKERAEEFFADDQLVLQSGQTILNKEEYLVLDNGAKKWQLTSKIPLKDNDGEIIGLVGIGRDITERKNAEEALRENEIKLNVILQSTADGILAIDSNGKVFKTNKRFAELWRIPQALFDLGDDNALIGFVLDQLLNPEEFISKVKKLYNSVEEDLDNLYFKDGRTFERYSAPLIMPDSSIGRVWSFRNITERLSAEEEIKRKNEELQKANSEKDKFFSIIAHDLRGPFNGFLGLTRIMAEELGDFSYEEIQKMAKSMEKSASNLYLLLENLLHWARMRQGLIPYNPTVLKMLNVVEETLSVLLEMAKLKGIKIEIAIPGDLEVRADQYMMNSLIRNLLSNALKFTPKGGNILVSANAGGDGNVVMYVKDSGIGMSPGMVENLFKLDFQLNRGGTEGEPSSGLGLILCKEFIEKHGGKLWVVSEVGKGSTFYFTIPVS